MNDNIIITQLTAGLLSCSNFSTIIKSSLNKIKCITNYKGRNVSHAS